MVLTFVPEKCYILLLIYPAGKWLLKNRLGSVITAVKESKDEEVDLDLSNVKLALKKRNKVGLEVNEVEKSNDIAE